MILKAFITAIDYYLPEIVVENPIGRLRKKTGIESVHISPSEMTAGDMAVLAAEKLFASGVDRRSIDFILLCTQSPDYFLPTTACIIQDRLKLNKSCGALDFNLGCSGFIYGLGLAKGLIETGQAKKILLITSETYSKYINPEDHSVKPLFGDGAAAILISAKESGQEGIFGFVYGTDGSGAKNLIVPAGGSRKPFGKTPEEKFSDDFGNVKTNYNLNMNGAEIMNFALNRVPETLEKILSKASLNKQEIDYYVFHQANKLILDSLYQICKLEGRPYWIDLKSYGNTVSASIPIALKDMMKENKPENLKLVVIIGFGVGLSWGGCIVNLEKVSL